MNFEIPNFHKVKSFSKEASPEERDDLADKLRESRAGYFEEKTQLFTQLDDVRKRKEIATERLADLPERLITLEAELEKRRDFSLRLVVDKLKNRNVRQEYNDAKTDLEAELLEAEGLAVVEARLLAQLNDRHILDDAKESLNIFYNGKSEELDQYLKEEKERQLDTVRGAYRERGLFFVHGIDPKFVPRDNSVLNCDVDWQTKLKIALSLEPTLSTSTVEQGDQPWRTWSSFGLIVSDGRILSARPYDAGTVAGLAGERRTSGQMMGADTVQDEINITLNRRSPTYNRYNEFTVESPRFSGLYIFREKKGEVLNNKYITESEIKNQAEQLGLPVYIIIEGALYDAHFDDKTESFVEGTKSDFETATAATKEFSEMDRAQIVQELAKDSPFRIAEIGALDSWSLGHRAYQESAINIKEDRENHVSWEESDDEKIGAEIELIAEFVKPGSRVQYLRKNNQIFVRERDVFSPHRQEHEYRVRNITQDLSRHRKEGGVFVSSGIHVPFEGMTDSPQALFNGLKQKLESMENDYYGTIQNNANEIQKKFWMDLFEKIGFFLHGFAGEAKLDGDTALANNAEEIASRLVDLERRKKIVGMIDNNGKLLVDPKELFSRYGANNK